MTFQELQTASLTERAKFSEWLLKDDALASLAVFFVSMVWIPAMVMSVLYIGGVRNIWVAAAVASISLLAWLCIRLFRGLPGRQCVWLAAIVMVAIVLAGFVSVSFFDSTGDGRWYHEDAILGCYTG